MLYKANSHIVDAGLARDIVKHFGGLAKTHLLPITKPLLRL